MLDFSCLTDSFVVIPGETPAGHAVKAILGPHICGDSLAGDPDRARGCYSWSCWPFSLFVVAFPDLNKRRNLPEFMGNLKTSIFCGLSRFNHLPVFQCNFDYAAVQESFQNGQKAA